MADNSNNRKKALIFSVLAFLLAGGGVFLFFVIQGSNDITGAKNKNFHYGEAAREAATSFFKSLGFDDVESVAKEGVKDRPRLTLLPDAKGPMESASAAAPDTGWGPPTASAGGSASPTSVPRMAGKSSSGVGGLGGGGSKSSGGVSRFGEGSDTSATSISGGKSLAGAGGPAGKGTLNSLKNARAVLGEGLRSGSAMTAKGKWDASFGVNSGARGGSGGELAYAKSGLVKLDSIKSGEVDNLKTTDMKSLKVPEPGAFKEDKAAEAKDAGLQKAKEDAGKSIKDNLVKAGAGEALDKLGSGSKDGKPPVESGSCDLNAGPPTALCSAALDPANTAKTDTSVDYKQVGSNANGKIYEVAYNGRGPGITDGLKGQDVNYSDKVTMQVDAKGNVTILEWKPPVEIPAANIGIKK